MAGFNRMTDITTDTRESVLQERIESLEIQLKHLRNDLKITREEYDTSVRKYFEIYTNLENIVKERTQDLTTAKNILEQKGRELQIMLDASPALIYYKNVDHTYLRVNRAFAEILQLPIREIPGSTDKELFPDKEFDTCNAEKQIIESGKPVLNQDIAFPTSSGIRYINLHRFPYRDAKEKVIGIIGFGQDVTELRQSESERKALEEQLTQAQKLESIGVLAGGIAHDFNNLLGVILGYSQLALHDLGEGSRGGRYLEEVIKSAQRGADIVKPLLDYAKPQKYEFKPVNLYERAEFVVKQLRKSAEFDWNHITCTLSGTREAVAKADAVKIEQVLLNLGKNALQAIPHDHQGEIEFLVELKNLSRDDCKLKLGLTPGAFVQITISDNGVGIPQEIQEKVFDPFFTTKQIGEGTGLGLSQAYSIIKKHQGFIELHSKPGSGTSFILYLHQYHGLVEEEANENFSPEEFYHQEGRVLVIEDTDQLRDMVKTILEEYGYQVEIASNGLEGVKLFETFHPDLTILDVKMPVMDGVEAFKIIRKKHPAAKIIFSTGYGMSNHEIMDIGANDYLSKPYEPVSLVKKIHDTIHS